jgi:hypothetical protein
MTTFIRIGATDYRPENYSIPSERTFRSAWDVDESASAIVVNMERAKDVWREKIRYHRQDELASLDTAYMRALETGEDTTDIIAQKQALRDAPALPSIDAATTPDELTSIQPIPNIIIE